MKIKYLTLLYFFLLFISCNGQDKEISQDKSQNKNVIQMDSVKYNKYQKIFSISSDTFNIQRFDEKSENFAYIYIDSLGNKVEEGGGMVYTVGEVGRYVTPEELKEDPSISVNREASGYSQRTYLKENPLLYFYKKFYLNGKIKRKKLFFVGNQIGVSQEFNEQGKLIKETNEDAEYNKITYEDIINFLIQKELYNPDTKETKGKLFINFIKKGEVEYYNDETKTKEPNDRDIWDISNFVNPPMYENVYKIDAETGKVLSHLYYGKEQIKKETSYKMHKGKTYTQEEWKYFEEQEYQNYVAKKNNRSFLADE